MINNTHKIYFVLTQCIFSNGKTIFMASAVDMYISQTFATLFSSGLAIMVKYYVFVLFSLNSIATNHWFVSSKAILQFVVCLFFTMTFNQEVESNTVEMESTNSPWLFIYIIM